ncbi:hypothetical protein JCM21900_004012 [Sporobolomyces salmonicolor]
MPVTRPSAASNKPLRGSWEPSPSPSPPPSPAAVDLSLSDADRLRLLETHSPLKPSDLDSVQGGRERGKQPLMVVSPEELEQMVEKQRAGESQDDGDGEGEQAELPLWEEVANAVLWTIPFGFLFSGMDYAVHAQFGQDLVLKEEIYRVFNIVPALFLLNFFLSRPPSKALLRPFLIQSLLLVLCVSTGISLVHVTTTEGYLNVMKQAPGLGVLWCWSVVRMDLGWATAGLLGVAAGVWARGERQSVMWWRP